MLKLLLVPLTLEYLVRERRLYTEGCGKIRLKIVSGIILALLLIGMLPLALNIQPAKAEPNTIIVPDDYEKIQWAIGNASAGDTIFVRAGTYYENLVVNKTVSLIGENRSSTIVDGNFRTGFHVISDYVNISGFTIRNCGPPEGGPFGGIHLDSSDNCTISGNIINDNYKGVWPDSSSNNNIFNNVFSNCVYAIGGVFMSGNNQKIFNNIVSNNSFGIYLGDSTNSLISNNSIFGSQSLSVYLMHCSNVILINNNMSNNIYSLSVSGWYLSHFIHDIDASNTVDGKPVYYLINQNNLIIDPLTFPDIGYLGLVNSTNIVIKDLNLTRSGQGLLLAYTTRSTVAHLNISYNRMGVNVFSSSNITFTDNKIMSNRYQGIELLCCNGSTISKNTISNNGDSAIQMGWSNSSIIKYNILSDNGDGFLLLCCHSNTIHHNNFISKVIQVRSGASINSWDIGYPYGGNYWSDYTGIDIKSGPNQDQLGSDGIGDTPYVIDENNRDNYPIMDPDVCLLTPFGDLNEDGIVDIDDIMVAALAFGSYPGHPRWNPIADLNEDGIVDIDDIVTIAIRFGETV